MAKPTTDPAPPGEPMRETPHQRQHLPHDTRRTVVANDGMQCAYVAPDGTRCGEQTFLQFHHESPWARSRDDAPSNLKLYCFGHNRYQAELDFGTEHVERKISEARAKAARSRRG